MNGSVADGAVLVSHVCLVMQARGGWRSGVAYLRMALHAQLPDRTAVKHLGVAGTVRGMASRTALSLERSVFESEWPLLIAVALDAGNVAAYSQLSLLGLKSSVRIVTVAAFHGSFEHFVMKRFGELRLCFGMAAQTKLWFTCL